MGIKLQAVSVNVFFYIFLLKKKRKNKTMLSDLTRGRDILVSRTQLRPQTVRGTKGPQRLSTFDGYVSRDVRVRDHDAGNLLSTGAPVNFLELSGDSALTVAEGGMLFDLLLQSWLTVESSYT